MPTAPTPIDPVPTPVPSTSDPGNFDARADATLGWLPNGIDQINAVDANVYANALEVSEAASDLTAAAAVATDAAGLVGKSTSTLTVAAGTKTIHLSAPKPSLATLARRVAIVSVSDPSIKMFGNIATTDGADDITVTVASNGVFGSGSYSNWQIIDAAFYASGATAAEERRGETDAAASTPLGQVQAMAIDTLTDAATVAWDTAVQGPNAKWTLTGNNTLGAPTNLKDGLVYSLTVNPATYTPAWASIFNFGAAGAPSLPASVWSKLSFQYDAARGKLDVVGVFRGA